MGMALLMASCTDDYKDWATPFSNGPEEAYSIGFTASPASPIDFATVTADKVQVFNGSVSGPEGAAVSAYEVYLVNEADASTVQVKVDADGFASTEELEAAVYSIWGRRPVARTTNLMIGAAINVKGASFVKTATTTLVATPDAPEIEEAYYITGTPNGWDNTNTSLELTNGGGDVYENPVFSVSIPATGSDIEFKVTPKSGLGGDWSKCLTASDTEGKFATNNAGGNFNIKHVEGTKVYRVQFNMLDQTWSYVALSFDPFVFYIGATDGWANAEQKLALTDENTGIYTGYIYCADPNGWGNCFKFQKVAGDWGTEINTGHMTGGMTGGVGLHDGDTNFEIKDGEGVYFMTLNLSENKLNAVKINNMNLVGDFNGWNAADDAQQMKWNATDFCFEITGAGVNTNGWKFTANNGWDINLGGNDSVEPSTKISDLAANGKNLGVAGSTIKLYPTRKTNDKIYCTVE